MTPIKNSITNSAENCPNPRTSFASAIVVENIRSAVGSGRNSAELVTFNSDLFTLIDFSFFIPDPLCQSMISNDFGFAVCSSRMFRTMAANFMFPKLLGFLRIIDKG